MAEPGPIVLSHPIARGPAAPIASTIAPPVAPPLAPRGYSHHQPRHGYHPHHVTGEEGWGWWEVGGGSGVRVVRRWVIYAGRVRKRVVG